jgi:hypothetical protein
MKNRSIIWRGLSICWVRKASFASKPFIWPRGRDVTARGLEDSKTHWPMPPVHVPLGML